MPSSISNSKDRIPDLNYVWLWCVALGLVVIVLGGLECGLRSMGYRPSVVDDMDLWCQQRMHCDQMATDRSILLIGSSRAAADLDPELLAQLTGYEETINLSVSGQGCFAILQDTAENTEFNGLLLCTVKPSQIRVNEDQQPWASYYHRNYKNLGRVEKQINRSIKTFLQSKSVAVNPPLMALKRSWEYGEFCARGQVGTPNRQTKLQYDRLPSKYMQRIRRSRVDQQLARLDDPRPVFAHWRENLSAFDAAAAKIVARGGKVVLVRLPTTEEYLEVDHQLYPRDPFWKAVEQSPNLEAIHFEDVPGMTELHCPETSHLSENSIESCTKILAKEINERSW